MKVSERFCVLVLRACYVHKPPDKCDWSDEDGDGKSYSVSE